MSPASAPAAQPTRLPPARAALAGSHAQRPGVQAEFDECCIEELVTYSKALRLPMTSAAVVIASIVASQGAWPWACLWLLLAVGVREVRAAALLRLASRVGAPAAVRLRQITLWTLALGIAHGMAALFMLSLETTFDAVLTMILMSLSAGAVSTTYAVPRAFLGYSSAIALPLAAVWLSRGDVLGAALAVLVCMALVVQLRFARQNRRMFEGSFMIRLENVDLLEQLQQERREIAQARDDAERANRSKSEFLAAASHDLRQPLQSLSLNSGALSRRSMDAETREIAEEMSAEIESLRRSLDALLDVSKLDAGGLRPDLRVIRLDQLLAGLVGRLRATAQAKGLQLECSCPSGARVLSDAEMLPRLFSNLLDNAIKFTQRGGVGIVAQPSGDGYEVRITDTGCGIPQGDQQRVFEDLVQLNNAARDRSQGHGLGLGIVRRLAALLAVRYRMTSQPGVGTTFVVEVAGCDPAAARANDVLGQGASPHALQAVRILVLEDEPSVRRAYEHSLNAIGCVVRSFANVAHALEEAPAFAPQIAVVDYRLGGAHDGIEAVEMLRAIAPELRAVVVSADLSSQLHARAGELRVPVLRKPVSAAALIAVLDELNAAVTASPSAANEPSSDVSQASSSTPNATEQPR